jgi:acyl-coenzyme A thioesterase PaaI-like protein
MVAPRSREPMNKQPNSRFCFVCGLENPFGLKLSFYQTGPKEVTAHYTVPEQYQGYPGTVHGGVVAAMLDEVAGRSLMGLDVLNTRFMYTARLTVQYRKNVPVAKPLQIVGRVKKEKSRVATASASIFGPSGDLLAEAEALLVDVPADVIDDSDLDALGWKVYPDEQPLSHLGE